MKKIILNLFCCGVWCCAIFFTLIGKADFSWLLLGSILSFFALILSYKEFMKNKTPKQEE